MLNNMELKDIQEIESKYYMRPILEKINSQPSTVTKSNSLNGMEIIAGGNITIPIDIRVVETIISTKRNGR